MCWCRERPEPPVRPGVPVALAARVRPEALGGLAVRFHPAALGAPEARLPPATPPAPEVRLHPAALGAPEARPPPVAPPAPEARLPPEAPPVPGARFHPAALGAPEARLPPEAPPVPGVRSHPEDPLAPGVRSHPEDPPAPGARLHPEAPPVPGARFRLEDPVVRGSPGVPGDRDSLWGLGGPVLPGGRESPGMGSRRNRTRQHFWVGGIWGVCCCLTYCITAFLEDIFIPEYAAGEKGVKSAPVPIWGRRKLCQEFLELGAGSPMVTGWKPSPWTSLDSRTIRKELGSAALAAFCTRYISRLLQAHITTCRVSPL